MNATRGVTLSLFDRLAQITASVRQAMRRRAVYRETLRELNALTSRELNDLGIHRAMINRIALEAAYGE